VIILYTICIQSDWEQGDNLQIWRYIENPEKSGEYWWMWVKRPRSKGIIADNIFQINNGDTKLESMRFTLENGSGGAPIFGPATNNASFITSISECPPSEGSLLPGASDYVGGGEMTDPMAVGTTFRATIKLCSEDDLNDVCGQQAIEFVMTTP
jgi:hypothetical protein